MPGTVCLSGYVCHVQVEKPMVSALNRNVLRTRGTTDASA
jgi:hypothetical protein